MGVFDSSALEYLIITITVIVALSGIILNTDSDKKGVRKKINTGGWILIILAITSYVITVFSTYESNIRAEEKINEIQRQKAEQERRYSQQETFWKAQNESSESQLSTLKLANKKVDYASNEIIRSQNLTIDSKNELIVNMRGEIDDLKEEMRLNLTSLSERIYFSLSISSYERLDTLEFMNLLVNIFGEKITGKISIAKDSLNEFTSEFIYHPVFNIGRESETMHDLMTAYYDFQFYTISEDLIQRDDLVKVNMYDNNQDWSRLFRYEVVIPKLFLDYKDRQLNRELMLSDIYASEVTIDLSMNYMNRSIWNQNCFLDQLNIESMGMSIYFTTEDQESNRFAFDLIYCNDLEIFEEKFRFRSDKKISFETINQNLIKKRSFDD